MYKLWVWGTIKADKLLIQYLSSWRCQLIPGRNSHRISRKLVCNNRYLTLRKSQIINTNKLASMIKINGRVKIAKAFIEGFVSFCLIKSNECCLTHSISTLMFFLFFGFFFAALCVGCPISRSFKGLTTLANP